MNTNQQVMSPKGHDIAHIVSDRPSQAADSDLEDKGQYGEQVTVPVALLQRLESRLNELEKRESSRKEDEAAAKEGSRIFRQWNASKGQKLTMEDLGHVPGRGLEHSQPPYIRSIPYPKQMRLMLNKFDGKETYKGLGSGFREWGERYFRAIDLAQRHCGIFWSEDIKIDCLSQYLDGKALSYFNAQYMSWWDQEPTLLYAMDKMYRAFCVQLTMKQAMSLFEQQKDQNKSFIEHLSYLVAVNAAAGGGYTNLVVESVVKHSCPELRDVLLARYDPYRQDHLKQAEELTHFAQSV